MFAVLFSGALTRLRAQAGEWDAATEAGRQALEQGRRAEAEKQFRLALDQARASRAGDPAVAACLDNLAGATELNEKRREHLFRESLAIRERTLGANHADVARSLAHVASTLVYDGPDGQVEQMLARATRIMANDPYGVVIAEVSETLGMARHSKYAGHADELRDQVEPLYRRALAIREQAPGEGELDLAFALELNAVLLAQSERTDEAKPFAARASQIRMRHVQKLAEASAVGSGEAFKIGGVVGAPTVISKREPEYTDAARKTKLQGTIVLQLVVTEDGSADSIRVVRSLGLGLDEQAFFAIRDWKFRPGQKEGRPVRVNATIEVNLRLL